MLDYKTLSQKPVAEMAEAFSSANIALCKYWGKRNKQLNLPINSSLSISLERFGTRADICIGASDMLVATGKRIPQGHQAYTRLFTWLDLILGGNRPKLYIRTHSNIPMGAGLASSASSYAAISQALRRFFGWDFDDSLLSIFARIGSVSAARSIYNGFVSLPRGVQENGLDCYAKPIPVIWPEFRLAILRVSLVEKKLSSREGMNLTTATSPLYRGWSEYADQTYQDIFTAIHQKDFSKLGELSERNALAMHGTMLGCNPPLIYFLPDTLKHILNAQHLRSKGVEVYSTIDAGANVKLLFLQPQQTLIEEHFPNADIIIPFRKKNV